MSQIQGVVIGIVKEIESGGNSLGRVKVYFPWMSDDNKTFWARVATTFAGNGRGTWFMPEKEDEVLVAFEHGDVQNAYVIGQLWSKKRKPPLPDDSIDEKVRRIQTVANHRVDFDDRSGKERIYIESNSDHKFEMQDFSPGHVKVETKGQQQVLMEDSPKKITIKTAGAPQIVMTDPSEIEISVGNPKVDIKTAEILISIGGSSIKLDASGVTVDAPMVTVNATGMIKVTAQGALDVTATGALTVNATGPATVNATSLLNVTASIANLTASGLLNVTAPIALFSGTLIATSIVSPTYSPGVGNLI